MAVLSGGTEDIVTNRNGSLFVPATPEVFKYDADGNLTNDGRWNYTSDGENRLLTITGNTNLPTPARLKLDFTYDYRGRRITKRVSTWNGSTYVGSYTNKFLYDGWNLIAEVNVTNGPVRSYLWGTDLSGSMDGAGGVGGLLAIAVHNSSVTNHFVAYDGNGNVSALLSASSDTQTAWYEYGPFGEVLRAEGNAASSNPVRFSSKFQDHETDLVYYIHRYYNASTGRWLSRDPIDEEGGLNLYALPGNCSINCIDPLGAEGFWSTFLSGSASDAYNVGRRFVGTTTEMALIGSDMIGYGLSSLYGAGGDYEGNSRRFQNIARNPRCYDADEMRDDILFGTLKAEANILTLGLLGMAEAAEHAALTGDYSLLQDNFFGMAVGLSGARLSQTAAARNLSSLIKAEARSMAVALSQTARKFGGRLEIVPSVHRPGIGTRRDYQNHGSEFLDDSIRSGRAPQSTVEWVDESSGMSDTARVYESGAVGARSNPSTRKRQAPIIEGPSGNSVRFDGFDGLQLVDRKVAVTTFPKSKAQVLRQEEALRYNELTARWEVPTAAQAARARKLFRELNIQNISVIVVPQ